MEIVKLKAEDYNDALDFLDFVFSKAYAPTHFGKMLPLLYQPTDEHMKHNFAIRENGRIRGIVGLFPAKVKVGNETLNLGGIGGVSAHPDDRGKGWMKLLMNRAIEEMKATDTDLSFLIGLRQRYQYFGYEKAGTLLEYKVSQTNVRHFFNDHSDGHPLQLIPIRSGDLSYIKKAKSLHDRQPIYCERPLKDFWLYLLSGNTMPWIALQSDGKAVGYLVTNEKKDRITEIFADDNAVFSEMIRSWFLQQSIDQSSFFLAPWQNDYARFLGKIAEEFCFTDNGNWRIYNWEKVVKSLLNVKNESCNLLNGSLLIGIKDYGTLKITVQNKEVECKKSDDLPDVEWDTFIATRMIFGHIPAAYVEEIPDEIERLLKSWFPLPLCWLIQNYV